jgi:hypothetical protein
VTEISTSNRFNMFPNTSGMFPDNLLSEKAMDTKFLRADRLGNGAGEIKFPLHTRLEIDSKERIDEGKLEKLLKVRELHEDDQLLAANCTVSQGLRTWIARLGKGRC